MVGQSLELSQVVVVLLEELDGSIMVLAWVDNKLKQHDGFGGLGHVLDGLLERLLRHQSE